MRAQQRSEAVSRVLLVVGAPRSGTTLCTRLVRELPGASGVPFETHYFGIVVKEWARRGAALLEPAEQREVLSLWQEDPRIGVALDLDRVVGTEPRSCAELFRALVAEVSLDPRADLLVEKTPGNLWMWRLFRNDQSTRFVALVRDPRAVVASLRGQEWALGDLVSACTWTQEYREICRMQRHLGSERVMVVRYEDLVADPEAFRSCFARLGALGEVAEIDARADLEPGELFRGFEDSWKAKALGQVDAHRVDAWREELTPEAASLVETMCGRELRRAGYTPSCERRRRTLAEWHAWLEVRGHSLGRAHAAESASLGRSGRSDRRARRRRLVLRLQRKRVGWTRRALGWVAGVATRGSSGVENP